MITSQPSQLCSRTVMQGGTISLWYLGAQIRVWMLADPPPRRRSRGMAMSDIDQKRTSAHLPERARVVTDDSAGSG